MDEEDATDLAILSMLLANPYCVPWSVDEVAREMGDRIAAVDGLVNLHGAGLIHRCGEFVWATRAARRGEQLVQ
jgi:hypothetical protein